MRGRLITLSAIMVVLLLLAVAALALPLYAQDVEPECGVSCPECNVNAEWKGHYYKVTGDNSAIISGTTPISVCVYPVEGHTIITKCVKAGRELYWQVSECFTPTNGKDVSSVTVCTLPKATAARLSSFTARAVHSGDIGGWACLVCYPVALVGLAILCLWLEGKD